jgi:predicted nucleic acid-binding protein
LRTAKKTSADPAFWDTSGLLLLATSQRGSARAQVVRRTTGRIVVWWGSRVEAASALARLVREGALDTTQLAAAERRLDALQLGAAEVTPTDEVRERARALVHAHPLRAADALQLAAALASVADRPRGRVFVSFDARLGEVARAVGFDVRP